MTEAHSFSSELKFVDDLQSLDKAHLASLKTIIAEQRKKNGRVVQDVDRLNRLRQKYDLDLGIDHLDYHLSLLAQNATVKQERGQLAAMRVEYLDPMQPAKGALYTSIDSVMRQISQIADRLYPRHVKKGLPK